ncbi:MAG: hypothetical protein ACE5GK_09245 [Nitrospiria bacterium]
MIRWLEKIVENPEKFKTVKRYLFVLGVGLVVFDGILIYLHLTHPIFPWDYVPGFSALFGLVSTYVIIVISKWLGHAFLMKREDFYD